MKKIFIFFIVLLYISLVQSVFSETQKFEIGKCYFISGFTISADGSGHVFKAERYGCFHINVNGKENKQPYTHAAFTLKENNILALGYIEGNYVFLEKIEF
jgi:hypothetical protein